MFGFKKSPKPEKSKGKDNAPDKGKNKKASKPAIEIEIPDADDELLEVVEVVEEDDVDVAEVVSGGDEELGEVVEVVEDEAGPQSGKAPPKPRAKGSVPTMLQGGDDDEDDLVVEEIEEAADVSLEDDEPVVVDLASGIDIDKLTADQEKGSSSDIINEALESGVDLGKREGPKAGAAKKSASDSDIDLDSILAASDDSSDVNIGGSGDKPSLPAAAGIDTKRNADEAMEVGDDLLVDAAAADNDELLVAPKKKPTAPGKKESPAAVADDVDWDDVAKGTDDDAAVEIVDEEEPAAPSRGGKGREPELVGAGGGGGRKRGGFMPFMFGGFLAILLLGGGGAAAWYFDALPKSPMAPVAKAVTKGPGQPIISKSSGKDDEEMDQLKKDKEKADLRFAELKSVIDDAKLPAEPDKLKAQLEAIAAGGKGGDDKQIGELLAKVAEAEKKLAEADAAKNAAEQKLAQAGAGQGGNDKVVADLMTKLAEADKKLVQAEAAKNAAEKMLAQAGGGKGDDGKLVADLMMKLAEADKKLTQAEAAKNVAEQKLAQAGAAKGGGDKEVAVLQAAKLAAEQKLKEVSEELDKARLQAADLAKMTGDKGELQKQLGEAVNAQKVLEAQYKDALKAQEALNQEHAAAVKANQTLTSQRDALKAARDLAMKELETLRAQAVGKPALKPFDKAITKPTVVKNPVIVSEPNPWMADKHYTKGLELFWGRNYGAAEGEFAKAISFYSDDARFYYYVGLSRYLQGTQSKRQQAHADFVQGAQLERQMHPGAREINASLERIQGELRKVLNTYREGL